MLGVLKRRLKPKRAASEKENQNSRKNVHNKSEQIVPVDVARIAPSQRQIHPLFEEKLQLLAYDDRTNPKKSTPTPNIKRSPDDPLPNPLLHLPKKSPVETFNNNNPSPPHLHPPTPTTPTYSPAPNICVEGGRIEFIKSPSEGTNLSSLNPSRTAFDKRMKAGSLSQYAEVGQRKSVGGLTRAQQTQADLIDFEVAEEKCDVAKEFLEARIKELQRLLESEQRTVQRERLAVTRLQRQLAKREAIQRDVDKERRLRADTESRLRETVSESERYRASLAGLQREFSKMEDTVRTMLQYKTRCELLNQEKVFLTAAYESRVHQYQNTITKLGQENESLKQQVQLLEGNRTGEVPAALLERLRSLETENAHLSRDADFQRSQYEKCLDDIANQVVRALLSQKGLREEIGNLQRRIKELENQNNALANILVNKLDNRGSVFALPSTEGKSNDDQNDSVWFPGSFSTDEGNLFANVPESLDASPVARSQDRKRLRRLHFSDLGDKNILKSLSSFESLVVVPLQRPRSLNLHLHTSPMALSEVSTVTNKRCQQKRSKLNLVTLSKKPKEDEGNESPESGNRDEGYSTMSSDVQGTGETNEFSKTELEDLKEASDETDIILDSNGEITSIVVVEDMSDPDMFFIPLNLTLAINPRHSYPPTRSFLPFQHAMRSFSDSHLYLKLTTTTASPISSPISPSMFVIDLMDKNHPLRRSKATSSLLNKGEDERDNEDTQSNAGSWCSGVVDGCWWDTEYVQHWLKLDDTRLKHQQNQRDMLQLEYDRTEIEEWTMSLSCEDVAKSTDGESSTPRKMDALTPGQLPSIQENESGHANKDGNEWNDYNCINLTVDTKHDERTSGNWSYEGNDSKEKSTWQISSPRGSWSSVSSNNSEDGCRSLNDCYLNDCSIEKESKRSSIASDDAEESSAVGTDFTRDFYRLVKFESTKSLASNSSKSNGHCDLSSLNQKQPGFPQDRELALQSVLNFIAEQQRYCHDREEEDFESQTRCRPSSLEIEAEKQNKTDFRKGKMRINGTEDDVSKTDTIPEPNHVRLSDIGVESDTTTNDNIKNDLGRISNVASTKESTGNTSLNNASMCSKKSIQRKSNFGFNGQTSPERQISTKLPVRNSKSVSSVQNSFKNDKRPEKCLETTKLKPSSERISQTKKPSDNVPNKPEPSDTVSNKEMSESFTSSVSTPETVVLQFKEVKNSSPSAQSSPSKSRETGIPVSISRKSEECSSTRPVTEPKAPQSKPNPRVRGTKIPVISSRSTSVSKPKHLDLESSKAKGRERETNIPMLAARRGESSKSVAKKPKTPESSSSKVVVVDDTSFHEKATTKDVIDELNRMIRKGEEVTPNNGDGDMRPLDMTCCCPTGWVHVERDIDFTDPKARANLLDVMLASSGSSGGSGSSSDSGGDEPVDYTHLHRLHRFRRQRKASATREQLGVLRYPLSSARPSILGRENFFVRYGDREKEAVASFDFLEDISTTSVSGCSSCDSLGSSLNAFLKSAQTPSDQELPSTDIDIGTPVTPTTPITPSDDSDERTGGPVSLSDSCADSFSESMGSLEEQS